MVKQIDLLPEDRFFGPDSAQKKTAGELYESVKSLPLVCPHGHVDPRLFSDPSYSFGSPADLLIIPDHYVFRMLYSQGVSLESLGIPRWDGKELERDHRKIWQTFAENFYLFRGTPSGVWLTHELYSVFGIAEKLNDQTAQRIYSEIKEKLSSPEFKPRRLFEKFNIEVLCTTDGAADTLEYHQAIKRSGWSGRIIPTFRPDAITNLDVPGWRNNLSALERASEMRIESYRDLISALELRRAFFKEMGAKATDHGVTVPFTGELKEAEAEVIFNRALHGKATPDDALRFTGHMLMEMARMSVEDGLTMQLHAGVFRNHNADLFRSFGPDKGSDIPVQTEFTRNLHALLNKYGTSKSLRLILFTLDESAYSRELAPLVGHYPALRLGPPWWFHDSLNGMARYFDTVMETAGIYNTAGFNDDTRAFCSIPARHDVWRRASANWVAGLFVRRVIDFEEALQMTRALAYDLAKQAYGL